MEKILFLINPVAGKLHAKDHLMKILQTFSDADFSVTVRTTRGKGDAVGFVAENAENYDRVVCCGGDGTLSETIAGLVSKGLDLPVGYIPAGSTNDLAHTLGLPSDIDKAAENIVTGVPTGLDIGLINGQRTFSYVASFGLFTRTSYSTPQPMKNALGHLAYLLSGIKELGSVEKYTMTVDLGGEQQQGNFIFGAITNSLSIGGVFKFAPSRVALNDGCFETLLIRAPKNLIELGKIAAHLQDGSYDDPNLVFTQTDKITLSCDRAVPWTVDGEFGGNHGGAEGDLTIQNLHNRIRIILPEKKTR